MPQAFCQLLSLPAPAPFQPEDHASQSNLFVIFIKRKPYHPALSQALPSAPSYTIAAPESTTNTALQWIFPTSCTHKLNLHHCSYFTTSRFPTKERWLTGELDSRLVNLVVGTIMVLGGTSPRRSSLDVMAIRHTMQTDTDSSQALANSSPYRCMRLPFMRALWHRWHSTEEITGTALSLASTSSSLVLVRLIRSTYLRKSDNSSYSCRWPRTFAPSTALSATLRQLPIFLPWARHL